MPANRYAEDDYGRNDPRSTRRTTDTRERERDPRESGRDRRTMDVDRPTREVRMVDPMDRGIDMRDRIANTAATRVEPRSGRTVSAREDDIMYDSRTANQYPRETRRTPYEDDFRDLPPSNRPIIDTERRDDQGGRPRYNEYFLPGEGIDREVIQSEICRYLGQDATCKPGTHSDGRRGFIIRGYRALTTEMIRSLKEDSQKYVRERENAARRNVRAVPYAQLRDQVRYEDTMMIDDDDRREPRYPTGYPDMDPRMTGIRQQLTTSYAPESGYAAYAGQPGVAYDPRYMPAQMQQQVIPGNTTPPLTSNRTPTGYPPQAYAPVTTRAPGQPMISTSGFSDYRPEGVRPSQYPPETGRRHNR